MKEVMMHKEMIECKTCGGSGGPPDFWNEEEDRWEYRVCSACSGTGFRTLRCEDGDVVESFGTRSECFDVVFSGGRWFVNACDFDASGGLAHEFELASFVWADDAIGFAKAQAGV